MSSAIGSTLGLLVAGTVLIFIFVGVLVGGIVGAFADVEASAAQIWTSTTPTSSG